jgi:antitoxin MazE
MQTRVQKWGNSLALRIPKTFADEIAIAFDSPVEVSIVDGKLIVIPIEEPEITLEELLAGITPENLHDEIRTGTAVGNEVW